MAIIGGRAHNIEQIHEVGKLGYPFVEISLEKPEEIKEQLDDLLKLKETYNIFYLAHYPNEGNPSDINKLKTNFIPKMKMLFKLSHDLGISKGTMHFWMDRRWASPSLISAKIELLSDLVDHATQCGIVLCIENLTERSDSFSTAFNAIPNLRMTMDIGHGELLSKENTTLEFTEHLFQKIAHIHVHDNYGGTSVKDDLHLALGEGIVDFPKILTLFNKKGYESTITMEVMPVDMQRTLDAILRYIS